MSRQKLLSHIFLGTSLLFLSACGGGGDAPASVGTPPPGGSGGGSGGDGTTKSDSTMEVASDVADFLSMAGFGSSAADQETLTGTDAADWLRAQFNKPATLYLPPLQSRFESGDELESWEHRAAFWDAMVQSDDELRQRMVFALSQLLVASDEAMGDQPLIMAYYMDVLSKNAFGNYRDLLEDITYSPAMAKYLTYLRNRKADPEKGRMPDENYAREIMQLFTIGLVELNKDGTPKTDSAGNTIETYSNDDIMGLARVFTGLTYKGVGFWERDADAQYKPLVAHADRHSELEKTFLGKTISAGTGPEASIDEALDHLFNHSNTAPFVSRQLIQRFTMSHPTPEYVERVATAFETGVFTAPDNTSFGRGERGDLAATLAAILLDESVLPGTARTPETGKIREPVIRWVHWAKAFNVSNVDASNEWGLLYSDTSKRLSQRPFGSPSVFNFYRPGYVAPGSETGQSNLTAPEFQIVHEGAAIGYANFMSDFALDRSPSVNSEINTFKPDYSYELTIADDAEALADHLDGLLLGGRMSAPTRERIVQVLAEIPIREDADRNYDDKFARVGVAVTMTVTDPAFTIQY